MQKGLKMLSLGLLSLLLPTILGEQLLTFQDPSLSRNIRACLDSSILTCNKVRSDLNTTLRITISCHRSLKHILQMVYNG